MVCGGVIIGCVACGRVDDTWAWDRVIVADVERISGWELTCVPWVIWIIISGDIIIRVRLCGAISG